MQRLVILEIQRLVILAAQLCTLVKSSHDEQGGRRPISMGRGNGDEKSNEAFPPGERVGRRFCGHRGDACRRRRSANKGASGASLCKIISGVVAVRILAFVP
jgi:hypothetical protein